MEVGAGGEARQEHSCHTSTWPVTMETGPLLGTTLLHQRGHQHQLQKFCHSTALIRTHKTRRTALRDTPAHRDTHKRGLPELLADLHFRGTTCNLGSLC